MVWWFLLAAVAVLFAYMRWEAGWLKTERIQASDRLGLRVAVLSDLHPAFCRVSLKKAQTAVSAGHPDLFLFLGDAVDKPEHISHAAAWLAAVANGVPAFAVEGNHDHKLFAAHPALRGQFREALSAAGIRLMADEQVLFPSSGTTPLLLIALDDFQHTSLNFQDLPSSSTNNDAPFRLLFTHNPQRVAELPEGFADFAVAGHFHGGQIWMPFGLEFRLFRREALGRIGVRRGLHTVNGIPLYLTRGIGNVLFPLRLGARPEITLIDL